MQALHFILSALFTLVVIAFLLRVLMPLVRADFRNPFGEAVLQVTNPLVLPLRKVMPPGKRLDPSSVVALLIVQFAGTALLRGVAGGGFGLESILLGGVYGLLQTVLQFYFFAVLLYALLSWFAGATYNPAAQILGKLVRSRRVPISKRAEHLSLREMGACTLSQGSSRRT